MISFNWTFPSFVLVPEADGLQNVVVGMNWMCTGLNSETGTSSSSGGSVMLAPPNPDHFVPYPVLTQEMALGWLSGSISMPNVENQISAAILTLDRQKEVPTTPPFS